MSASEVQICNMAIGMIGGLQISSLSETPGTAESRACRVLYPLLRDELVSRHPWNFAMDRKDISAQQAQRPAFGWQYAYTLPVNLLRMWELYGSKALWVVEGGELLTNQDSDILIRYIKIVTETACFTPAFCTCLATRIGAELAGKIKNDQRQRSALLSELLTIHLPAAYHLNALENNGPIPESEQPMDVGNYTWQTSGRG